MECEAKQYRQQSEAKDEGEVTAAKLEELRLAQAGLCYYSGRELTIDNVSLEHKIPLVRGGLHRMDNVVLCTKEINKAKGTLTDAEFVSLCMEVASHVSTLQDVKRVP